MFKSIKIIIIFSIFFTGLLFPQESGPYNLGVSSSNYDMSIDSNENIYLLWKTGTRTINVGKIVNNALTEISSFTSSWTIHTRFARPRMSVKPDGTEIHACFISTNLSTLAHVWRDSSGNWHEEAVWTYNNDGWYLAYPAIGVDASGYVHIIAQKWKSGVSGSYVPYWRKTSSWSSPVNIQTNDNPYNGCNIYRDKNGGIHATWNSGAALARYRYAASGASLADSPNILIPNLTGNPSFADHIIFGETCRADNGDVHYVYMHGNDWTFRHTKKPVGPGSFTYPTLVAPGNPTSYYEDPYPDIGVSPDNRVFVTWAENRTPNVVDYVMLAVLESGSWTVSEVTHNAAIDSQSRPVMAVTADGFYIVWRGSTGELMLSTDVSGGSTTPSITVQYPSGGEQFAIGDTIPIAWTTESISGTVKITLRKEDGSGGYVVVNSVSYDASPHNYIIPPDVATGYYFIKIKSDTLEDISGIFEIIPAGSAPTITVVSPNGGESYAAGSSATFTWASTGSISNVKIEFSPNNGGNWSTLFSSVPNTGSYSGIIPSDTPPSTNCLMRISDAVDGIPSDTSNGVFTITAPVTDSITVTYPNGGESFVAGSGVTFTWNSTGSIANVKIELSTNSGSDWSTLYASISNTGSYAGAIPSGATPSANCLVRISDAADGSPSDTSNGVFTITSGGGGDSITVTYPNGGEVVRAGTLQTLTWTSTGDIANVKIEFSPDNGSYWGTLFNSVPNTGSYSGIIPSDTPPSGNCLVRISDAVDGSPVDTSNSTFTILPALPINVIYPAGGENYTLGVDTIPITWTTSGITGDVKITLRKSDGSGGYVVIESIPCDAGSYNYPIPVDVEPFSYFIKIKDGGVSDTSDIFTISEPGVEDSLTVTSPNGGESRRAGDPITITWTTVGSIPNVRIELSINSGGGWTELVNSTPNTGTYTCIIPPETNPSSNCMVRISDSSDGSPFDLSNNVFTILPQLPISVTNPIGGETYVRGVSIIPISWATSGLSGDVKITLRKSDGSGGYVVVDSIPHDTGTYNYPIPADVQPNSYFIKIKNSSTEDISGIFTIN